jgi:hypothetical protein
VLRKYPKGSQIEVLYNPQATEMIVQSESLRAIQAAPGFWQEEARLRNKLAFRVLVPVPLTAAVYLAIRFSNRRSRKCLT